MDVGEVGYDTYIADLDRLHTQEKSKLLNGIIELRKRRGSLAELEGLEESLRELNLTYDYLKSRAIGTQAYLTSDSCQ